jgi:hypothetical protein
MPILLATYKFLPGVIILGRGLDLVDIKIRILVIFFARVISVVVRPILGLDVGFCQCEESRVRRQ